EDRVGVTGRYTEYERISDAGEKRTFRFCPDCGATVFWTNEGWPDVVAVPIGAFADPSFPQPTVSVYTSRRYPWLSLPDGIVEEPGSLPLSRPAPYTVVGCADSTASTTSPPDRRSTPVSVVSRCATMTGIAVSRITVRATTFTIGSCWPCRR